MTTPNRTRSVRLSRTPPLSIERLAVKAGVSSGTVRRFEMGRSVTLKHAEAIAAALETGLDELRKAPEVEEGVAS